MNPKTIIIILMGILIMILELGLNNSMVICDQKINATLSRRNAENLGFPYYDPSTGAVMYPNRTVINETIDINISK